MRLLRAMLFGLAFIVAPLASASAAERPVVLELFTSQGCDSCPPADKLLDKLAENPTVLALSYHVDYWDYIGWKDAFSLKDSTKRQYVYAARFHKTQVFTPQLIVDGQTSLIGSREDEVRGAIAKARAQAVTVPMALTPHALGPLDKKMKSLDLTVGAKTPVPAPVRIVAVTFTHQATTHVAAGENKGRSLISVNSVKSIAPLGSWSGKPLTMEVPGIPAKGDGIAVLLQDETTGSILGAASYIGM